MTTCAGIGREDVDVPGQYHVEEVSTSLASYTPSRKTPQCITVMLYNELVHMVPGGEKYRLSQPCVHVAEPHHLCLSLQQL